MRILHFADAHIDMANYGRHDPETGLPLPARLSQIIGYDCRRGDNEKVDMVIFAGDAYKDRSPAPTFQREWGRRIIRLSQAKIPTLLLVGNHDLSPAIGRAHAIQEFDTLQCRMSVFCKCLTFTSKRFMGFADPIIALPGSCARFDGVARYERERIHRRSFRTSNLASLN